MCAKCKAKIDELSAIGQIGGWLGAVLRDVVKEAEHAEDVIGERGAKTLEALLNAVPDSDTVAAIAVMRGKGEVEVYRKRDTTIDFVRGELKAASKKGFWAEVPD